MTNTAIIEITASLTLRHHQTRPAFDSRIWLITQKATSLVCNANSRKNELTPMPLFGTKLLTLMQEIFVAVITSKPYKSDGGASGIMWNSVMQTMKIPALFRRIGGYDNIELSRGEFWIYWSQGWQIGKLRSMLGRSQMRLTRCRCVPIRCCFVGHSQQQHRVGTHWFANVV